MIEGNITAELQVSTSPKKNAIGEQETTWHKVIDLEGFIDLQSGQAGYNNYNAKIQESTHVFVGDYKPIPDSLEIEGKTVKLSAENTRMVADSQEFDVLLIDNPMKLNYQWEIYLKYTGGQ